MQHDIISSSGKVTGKTLEEYLGISNLEIPTYSGVIFTDDLPPMENGLFICYDKLTNQTQVEKIHKGTWTTLYSREGVILFDNQIIKYISEYYAGIKKTISET